MQYTIKYNMQELGLYTAASLIIQPMWPIEE